MFRLLNFRVVVLAVLAWQGAAKAMWSYQRVPFVPFPPPCALSPFARETVAHGMHGLLDEDLLQKGALNADDECAEGESCGLNALQLRGAAEREGYSRSLHGLNTGGASVGVPIVGDVIDELEEPVSITSLIHSHVACQDPDDEIEEADEEDEDEEKPASATVTQPQATPEAEQSEEDKDDEKEEDEEEEQEQEQEEQEAGCHGVLSGPGL